MATKKQSPKKQSPKLNQTIIVEIPMPDGCLSMFAGRLVSRGEKITLVDAAWVACTGRRNLFFSGTPDSNCEIETYPDGVTIELPSEGAIVTSWPHAPLRSVR